MGNNASMVSTGKPKVTGAVHWAPKGTTIPTSVSEALDAAFVDLGYLSEDGVAINQDNTSIKAWGGDDVIVIKKTVLKEVRDAYGNLIDISGSIRANSKIYIKI